MHVSVTSQCFIYTHQETFTSSSKGELLHSSRSAISWKLRQEIAIGSRQLRMERKDKLNILAPSFFFYSRESPVFRFLSQNGSPSGDGSRNRRASSRTSACRLASQSFTVSSEIIDCLERACAAACITCHFSSFLFLASLALCVVLSFCFL